MLKPFVENFECHRVLCIVDSESDDAAISHSPSLLADADLTDAQHSELQSILSKFDRIFSDSPGHTTSVSHSINVTQQPFCGHLITVCPWQLNLPSNKNWIIC